MRIITLIFVLSFSLVYNCEREKDCHRKIVIKNLSSQTIIYATILYNGEDTTQLVLTRNAEIKPYEQYNDLSRICWEDRLKNRKFEFYVADPAHFNIGGFYRYDSIYIKNKILKHYIVTLEELILNNFVIVYK